MPSGDYLEVRLLGRGNYGEAWLVKNADDKKKYVLKRVDLRCANEKERQAAEQEAQLLSRLKHPNIVAYKESFNTADGFLCITMGFCEGGDLYHRLQQQNGVPLEDRQVIEWFVQISMAIKYMHDKCILHRDLKTQNIFLTKSEIIKVGDLGIARVLESSNAMATTMIGTPYYMSPELFSNKPYGYKSDIWALGCCVYEMMTLRHAFDAKNFNALAFRILQGKLPPMPVIYPTGLVNLVKAMLKKNPEKRPTIERILGDPFIKKHIALFLEKTKTKQSFVNKSRRLATAKAPVGASFDSNMPSHPRLRAKEEVSDSLETLHLGPDLGRIEEEASLHGRIDVTVRAKDSRNKVGAGVAKPNSKDLSEGRERKIALKTYSERPALHTNSPTPLKNSSKRDKHRKKKMAEEADKMSAEGRIKTVSDVGAEAQASGVKLVSDKGANKTAFKISRHNLGSKNVADVIESVHFLGNNVLYRKEVQRNQIASPDESQAESVSNSNLNKIAIVPDDTSNVDESKSSVSRKKSSDSVVSGKGEAGNLLGDNLQDRGSPNPKSRNRHIRKSSGDANMPAFPVILESVSKNSNKTVDNNLTKVEQIEDDLKQNESPKPKSRNRHARKSSGDSILCDNGKASDKTLQKVERVGSDLTDSGSPRPKSRNRHTRKLSGDAKTKAFAIVRKSSDDSSDRIQQGREEVETKPPKSKLSEESVVNDDSSAYAHRNARHRVNVGRPLPPLVKLAAEPKEAQFHRKPRQFLVAASADDSTPVSSSSASSANSSKDEMSDQPGSMNSSSRQRRRKMKEKEGGSSSCAKSIDIHLASSEDIQPDDDPSMDSVDGFIPRNDHRPVSRSFDVLRNPLHYTFWAEDPSFQSQSQPSNSRSSIDNETIPIIGDLESSSSESLEEAETLEPKGPRYKEIKSFISLLCSTLLMKEEKADEEVDVSDEDADSSSIAHKVLSSSASDTPLFIKRPLPTSIQHNAKSFTDFRQTMTDSFDKPSYNRDDSYEYNGTSGRLFERISALRLDCINRIGQDKLDEALRLIDHFEMEEFDTKLIALLGTKDYADYAGKIWQLKFCLENVASGLR